MKKECPNCRTAVTSQMHSIVLDNYIDRMVEQLSEDMKERRIKLVAERKGRIPTGVERVRKICLERKSVAQQCSSFYIA